MSRDMIKEPPLLLAGCASNNVHAVIRFWGQGGERDKRRKREGEKKKSMREKRKEAREGKERRRGRGEDKRLEHQC